MPDPHTPTLAPPDEAASTAPRQAYHPPRLDDYGQVSALTRAPGAVGVNPDTDFPATPVW
jgi:hypothetical protein